MKVKAPEDVKEYIKSKFWLNNGEVVCTCPNSGIGPRVRFNHNIYSRSYIKDVLEGRDPDLSVLFYKSEGKLFRNNDPVWGTRNGAEVTKNGTIICGEKVLNDETIIHKPQNIKRPKQVRKLVITTYCEPEDSANPD